MILAAATIFSSAFLLFLVQPLTARRLLPWFGGSPSVWIVCLLFFQAILLAGYLYAHLLTKRLGRRRQAIVHALFLLGALAFLPIGPDSPPQDVTTDPTAGILSLLVASLALPLLVLSSTNPLLQRWWSQSFSEGDRRVYRLFAVSNLGSLLGLWAYPFLFEPWTSAGTQVVFWSVAFGVFVALSLFSAAGAYREGDPDLDIQASPSVPAGLLTPALWLVLPAVGAAMLMATSNQLTRNVASVPFLWVLPLSLYLLSFIVAFERDRWYARGLWSSVYLASFLVVLHLLGLESDPDFVVQLVAYSVNLFAGCLICHGELARARPRREGLTTFYLFVATGGALGGVAVSLVAPRVFSGYWEYPIALAAVYFVGGFAMLFLETGELRTRVFWLVGGITLSLFLGSYVREESRGVTFMTRGFFGVLRVYDSEPGTENWQRHLWNGPVAHGGQFMAPGRHLEPILYYGTETGVGIALSYVDEAEGRHIGVLGLGAGSIAIYGFPEDRLRFYEINPDVVEVAKDYFHYLEETPADVEIVVGDARLSLAREPSQAFDVLVLDAFTGDAVPIHLLTEEAFAVYDKHLKEDGILAVHISNLHFDFRPVVRALAETIDRVPVLVEFDGDPFRTLYVSDWILVTRSAKFISSERLRQRAVPWRADDDFQAEDYTWTDDYSNLLGVLK